MNTNFLRTALKGNDFNDEVVEELFLVLDLTEVYETALSELEMATTNFVLSTLKYMTTLPPKDELETLLPTLTKTRRLLGRRNEPA